MGRLIVQMQSSVDGFVSADDPQQPWQVWDWSPHWTWDDALKRDFNAVFERAECILLSRPMIEEGYLTHWSGIARLAAKRPEFAFAQRIVDLRKVVLSPKLKASRWERTELARGAFADEVGALKRATRGDILTFGGVGFASALLAGSLVDELQLYVNPYAVGRGRSIFGSGRPLKLLGARPYDCGIAVSRYAPA